MTSNIPWGKSFTFQNHWGSNISTGEKLITIVISHLARDLQYPRHPGLRAHAGHTGGTNQWLRPNVFDRYQDNPPGVFPQQFGLQHGLIAKNRNGGRRRARGVGLVVWDQPQVWSIELMRFHGRLW